MESNQERGFHYVLTEANGALFLCMMVAEKEYPILKFDDFDMFNKFVNDLEKLKMDNLSKALQNTFNIQESKLEIPKYILEAFKEDL